MKVYPDKLKAQLSKAPSPIYLVSGDEALLVQENCDLIRRELFLAGFTEREVYYVETGFDWEQVLFSANSMSLFADKKLIEIRMPGGKPGDKGAKVLTEFCENLSADVIMLIVTDRLDAATQRTKWFKNLEQKAAWVQLWPIEARQLPSWIQQRMRDAGLSAHREVVSLLSDKVEGNLLAAAQEIEKLKLISKDGRIHISQIVEDVADNARYDVFKLIDTVLSGDAAKALKMIRGLRTEGTELLQLTGMIARETRSLGTMASRLRAGQGLDAILKAERVWPKRKALISGMLRSHDYGRLARVHQQLCAVDRIVKGVDLGDPWNELISLLLELAGKARPFKSRPLLVNSVS